VAVAIGLELESELAVAVGDGEALLVGVGLDEPDVLAAGPHPTSTTANDKTTIEAALYVPKAVFMISPI
jgi:hypothetical protein